MAKSGIDLDGDEFLVCELEAMSAEERDGVLSRHFQQTSDEVREGLQVIRRAASDEAKENLQEMRA